MSLRHVQQERIAALEAELMNLATQLHARHDPRVPLQLAVRGGASDGGAGAGASATPRTPRSPASPVYNQRGAVVDVGPLSPAVHGGGGGAGGFGSAGDGADSTSFWGALMTFVWTLAVDEEEEDVPVVSPQRQLSSRGSRGLGFSSPRV